MHVARRIRRDWLLWLGSLLSLFAGYGGAYISLVEPRYSLWSAEGNCYLPVAQLSERISPEEYRSRAVYSQSKKQNEFLRKLFIPANWIDRTVRPGRWPGRFVAQ
jgi:hypothetical protein